MTVLVEGHRVFEPGAVELDKGIAEKAQSQMGSEFVALVVAVPLPAELLL